MVRKILNLILSIIIIYLIYLNTYYLCINIIKINKNIEIISNIDVKRLENIITKQVLLINSNNFLDEIYLVEDILDIDNELKILINENILLKNNKANIGMIKQLLIIFNKTEELLLKINFIKEYIYYFKK